MADKRYTKKQGQYLAFIRAYTLLHRQPPAHADIVAYFRVTAPTVVSMLDRLESKGLITRERGVARSIRVLLEPEDLPYLVDPDDEIPDVPSPPGPDGGAEVPAWSEDLSLIYQLRIDLDRARPPIWRRVLVPADISFEELHVIIQATMGWSSYHLHLFTAKGWDIGVPDPDEAWMGNVLAEDLEFVSDYLVEVGDRLKYEYDFGDGWLHTVKLEKVLEPDPNVQYPVCVKGRRACPPEDVGGIWGYAQFLEALGDPQHPDHDMYVGWGGARYDSELFDPEDANVRLRASVDDLLSAQNLSASGLTPPHMLTFQRWQMLLSGEGMEAKIMSALMEAFGGGEGVPGFEHLERLIEAPESPQALVDAVWEIGPLMVDRWIDRVVGYGSSIIPHLVEAFASVEQFEDQDYASWCRNQIALALHRFGSHAVPALVGMLQMASPMARSLVCLVLGQLDAREHADLVWHELQNCRLDDATGYFIGPLWSLIDLGDSRAADALYSVLEADLVFPELWAMLATAGDTRACLYLLAMNEVAPPAAQTQIVFALAAIAHRVGRDAVMELFVNSIERQSPDVILTPTQIAEIVDEILAVSAEEAAANFEPYLKGPAVEEFDDIAANMMRHVHTVLDLDGESADYLDPLGEWMIEDEDDFLFGDAADTIDPAHECFQSGRPIVLPGRNDPCWCGSGKKYKLCHWREDHLGDTG